MKKFTEFSTLKKAILQLSYHCNVAENIRNSNMLEYLVSLATKDFDGISKESLRKDIQSLEDDIVEFGDTVGNRNRNQLIKWLNEVDGNLQ